MKILLTIHDIVPIISCAVLAIAFLVGLGKMITESKRERERENKEREEF
jgi:hypothetical protein